MNNVKNVFGKSYSLPKEHLIQNTIDALSPFERVLGMVLVGVLLVSSFILIERANRAIMINVPAEGGSLTEGIVGTPRFINPLLALSDADRDLTALVYSGLLEISSDGSLALDLAESYEISEDGLTYTVIIKEDAVFHDGHPITAEDVVFTVLGAQNGALKSPKRANWDGVSVTSFDERTVAFRLKQPYAPFLENLTLGILPSHLWKDVDPNEFPFSQLNTEPVGSGPYRLKKIIRDSAGIPESYTLTAFRRGAGDVPFIRELTLRFYSNEDDLIEAYNAGNVEAVSGLSPDHLSEVTRKTGVVTKNPLPRVFGLFFNQNQNALFADKNVRMALNAAINKERIVNEVLGGYGSVINGPFPPGALPDIRPPEASSIENALILLEKSGWKKGEDGILTKGSGAKAERMSFSIATSDTEELKQASEKIKEDLTALGVDVTVKVFEPGDLNQNVIRPRNYEALFFGEVVGREFDLFAFWHSSQRNDPGLNIALYANITADALLEKARTLDNSAEREKAYREFNDLIQSEAPAVFIYAPDFIYIVPSKIQGNETGRVTLPSDRFNDIEKWYVETEWVWPVFANFRIDSLRLW